MGPTLQFQRRRLLHLLQDEEMSRSDLLRALRRVPDLELWMRWEAGRAGLERTHLEQALAQLGTRWARHAVKRFFLSPPLRRELR